MQPSKVKFLFILAIAIYGCASPNNTNISNSQVSVISSPSINQRENTIPSNTSTPVKSKETATPVKQLSALEIKSITDSGIVGANNQFAFDIFSDLVKKDSKKNIFISPASISFALTMTYNASDKETREAMGKVLHIGNLDLSTINNANKLLLDKLKSPAPDIQLEIANSLFGNSSFEFLPDFINNTKNFYNAKVNNFDFGNQELANENAQKINDWISSNTNNKINNVIEPESLSNNTLLYLINAIYFKSNWTNKFNEENTEPRKFFLSDGTTKEIPMMKQFSRFKYLAPNSYQGNNFQGIELPYGKDGKVSMYVFLPSDDSNLDELYKTINSTTGFQFEELIKNFYTEGGVIVLPKFKMSYKNNLNSFLDALGMGISFDCEHANFLKMAKPRITDEKFCISSVTHIANVDINEEGTEAEAVTIVEATPTSPASSEPMRTLEMIVDHPFFFMIRDNETEQILFMGSVTDPQS